MWKGFFFAFSTSLAFAQNAQIGPCAWALEQLAANPHIQSLYQYAATQRLYDGAVESIRTFRPQTGIFVEHDSSGNISDATIRVLTDNPSSRIEVIGDFNDWGKGPSGAILLHPDPNDENYHIGKIPDLRNNMEYRLVENGEERLDPSSSACSSEAWAKRFHPGRQAFLNSIFSDLDAPEEEATKSLDLRGKPCWINEQDLWGIAAKFPHNGRLGPPDSGRLYAWIVESGIAKEFAKHGNAIELLPITTYIDGDPWQFHYLTYGINGPDSRWGTPKEFRQMVAAFQREGVAVILDIVPGHFAHSGNLGSRDLGPVGMHRWRNRWGKRLFGSLPSPWSSTRPDYKNPLVRTFLIDSTLRLFRDFGISGVRIDNAHDIRYLEGGMEFLRDLSRAIHHYFPGAYINGESFGDEAPMVRREDWGGAGMDSVNNGDLYSQLFRPLAFKWTQALDLWALDRLLVSPWNANTSPRLSYFDNHDENSEHPDDPEVHEKPSTLPGAYPAERLQGGGDYYVYGQIKAFKSLARLVGPYSLGMIQTELLQRGSLSSNPEVDWSLLDQQNSHKTYAYFQALYQSIKDEPAFAVQNLHPHPVNHIDNDNKVISLLKKDFKRDREFYIVLNLGHRSIRNYRFGVDAWGKFRVVIDSDRSEFAGTNQLKDLLPGGVLETLPVSTHSKRNSIELPVLAPYQVLILEKIKAPS